MAWISPFASSALRALTALSLLLALPAFGNDTQQVGHVSLLIGEARVVRADGSHEVVQRSTQVRVGDRIETGANGHVHMRFIDNAALSVRPDSVLEVQAYRYDAARPELSEVRLRVEKGVSRSISGAATEFDKTRFRLTTPLAAIGVRGTDFTVRTDDAGVRATVSDGAITVGALGSACLAAGFGPCAGAGELSADMGRLMAELRPGEQTPRLVAAVDLTVADVAARAERSTARRAADMSETRAIGLAAAQPTDLEAQRGNDRAAAELLTLAVVPAPILVSNPQPSPVSPPVAPVPDMNRASDSGGQLVWGRWAPRAEPLDKLSAYWAEAALGRHVTVADQQTGLFRTNQSVPGQLFSDSLQGTVEFRLSRASATFESGSGLQAAAVTASNLTVDFTRRTFATALNLSSAGGVPGELRVAGGIRNDGVFTVKDTDQFVSGAMSLDGKEAGYLFERGVAGGLFRGRTLWGR